MGAAQYAGIFLPAVRLVPLVLLLMLLMLLGKVAFAAPPDVTSLFPAGGALGEEVQVTATGTFANWPPQVWISDDKLQVECDKDKGKLTIRIGGDAQPGIAWLRLIDGEGASAPRPFVISHLTSVREKEPNDAPKQSQQLAGSSVVQGKFDKGGDSDSFAIQLEAGQTLVAALQANEILGSPADGALQICSASGQVLAANQDAGSLDSLVTYRAPAAGTYLVRTFALPATPNSGINFAGGELFIYRLAVTTGPYADYALPLAVNASGEPTPLKLGGWNLPAEPVPLSPPARLLTEPWCWTPPGAAGLVSLRATNLPLVVAGEEAISEQGQKVESSCCISGVIAKSREVHRFRFAGVKGAKLAIGVDAAKLGFDLDPQLRLLAPDGSTLSEIDDTARNPDPVLNVTFAAAGDHVLEIRDQFHSGSPRHVYRLTIEQPQPSLALSVAAGNFVGSKGKPLEIPVTINRQNGFNDEVTISAVDLPAGVTAQEVTSTNKGDTAKQVKLMLTASDDAVAGPFRIVAQSSDGKELAAASYLQTLGGSTFQHSSLWLGVK
jgi:hypothetical protein